FGVDAPDFFHRLYDSGLVVGHHDADQPRIGAQRLANIVRVDLAAAIHRNNRELASHLLQALRGVEHGVMLNGRRDDVIALARQAEESKIIGFRAAAHEDDFRGTRVKPPPNPPPPLPYRTPP